MTANGEARSSRGRYRLFPGLPAALLMLSWAVPDIWATPPRFSHQLLSTMEGAQVFSLIAWPAAGALAIMAMFLPICDGVRSRVVAVIGVVGVVVPTGLTHPGIPLGRLLGVGGSALSVLMAAFLLRRVTTPVAGHVVLALLPGALLAMSIYGVMTGAHSAAYLWSFKAPLCLYLSMMIAAGSLRELTFSS